MANNPAPVTKLRIQVPRGTKVEDLISKLEISFEPAPDSAAQINTGVCCVDVSVVGPFSAVSNR